MGGAPHHQGGTPSSLPSGTSAEFNLLAPLAAKPSREEQDRRLKEIVDAFIKSHHEDFGSAELGFAVGGAVGEIPGALIGAVIGAFFGGGSQRARQARSDFEELKREIQADPDIVATPFELPFSEGPSGVLLGLRFARKRQQNLPPGDP